MQVEMLNAPFSRRCHEQGWKWGGAGPKDRIFVPASHDFVLPHPYPVLHDGENFLTPSQPLGAPRNPAPPHKTLLFVNFPYNQYNFFNETYFINENILKITTKFIPSNQTNFQYKLSKCLIRQHHNKNKNLKVQQITKQRQRTTLSRIK